MPTHKADLSRLSMSQLADLTGRSKETVSKLLRAAGLEPVAKTHNALFYVPRLALPVIYELGLGLSLEAERARLAKEQADAKAMDNALARGDLISAVESEEVCVAVTTGIRAALLALESKLAPALDSADNITARAAVIREHLYETLSALADLGDGLQPAIESDAAASGGDGAGRHAPAAESDGERVGG